MIASGRAKQALMVLRHAILDPKEEVVFPAPYCISDPEMIELAGGVPVPVTAEKRQLLSNGQSDSSIVRILRLKASACLM